MRDKSLRVAILRIGILLGVSCIWGQFSWAGDAAWSRMLKEHCVKCHGAQEPAADLNLASKLQEVEFAAELDLISDVLDAVSDRVMPPEGEPQVPEEIRAAVVKELNGMLEELVKRQQQHPRTTIRRMNRFQYNNAVQDLFKLDRDVFALPERMLRDYGYFDPASGKMPESLRAGSRPLGKSQLIDKRLAGVAPFPQDLRAENGFDNRGDHLSMSPLLMESFLKLSRSIVESEDFNRETVGIWEEFFGEPADDAAALVRKRLASFLHRAFRRPVDPVTLERYHRFAIQHRNSGHSWPEALKLTAAAVIASPRFLYLYDTDAAIGIDEEAELAAVPRKLDSYSLASRLSFFLWGSIPDKQLLELAASDGLQNAEVLSSQVDRMLNDRRCKRFCDSFPTQWLQLERIVSSTPDPVQFPEFYFAKFRVSMHMMLEPLLLFETVLIENRPLVELIDADFSYRSDLLISWYQDGTRGKSAPPTAIPFKRVTLDDRRQGGVITNAAVMTMTSAPMRTQPITRGAWMASVIFNDPPDPPPADVPPLAEVAAQDVEQLSIRDRFAAHRDRPECAACHTQIDPLGFALENYGPTGVWRDEYENGTVVDAEGTLFREHRFQNVLELKDVILSDKERFVTAFAEHLLSFALGRELSLADRLSVDEVVQRSAEDDYRLRTIIQNVACSSAFGLR